MAIASTQEEISSEAKRILHGPLAARSLRWWAGTFCVFIGAFMVVVPSQFTNYVFSELNPWVALWGIAFIIGGWMMLATAVLNLRPAFQAAAHFVVSAVFALMAGGFAGSNAWSGTIVYSLLSLATLGSAALPSRRGAAESRSGDLFALMLGIIEITLGLWMLLFVDGLDAPLYLFPPIQYRLLGCLLLVTGAPLAAVQVFRTRLNVVRGVHVAAGVVLIAAAVLTSWPARSWTGLVFYGFGGLVIGILPWLRYELRAFDPASLASRLALMMAAATSLPVLLTLAILELGNRAVFAEDQRMQAFLLLMVVVGIAIVMGFWGARALARPLRRLAKSADRLAADRPVTALPPTGITEMDRLSSAFVRMRGRLATRAREAEDLTRELRRRADALADADRRKDEFLAMLAHELRNPLGAITTASHLLDSAAAEDPVVGRATDVIQRQMQHLVRMVDDLLDVSRITRGKVDLKRQRLDLVEVVRSTVDIVGGRVSDAGLELSLDLPSEPLWLEADATRLEQILGNLLTNAIRYTEAGGHVQILVRRRGEDAVLRVTDDGIGMPPDLLSRVFDLFAQGERSLERRGGGLGIGLTLVRQLVEMHGGEVEARSAGVGEGSEFEVRLPAAG